MELVLYHSNYHNYFDRAVWFLSKWLSVIIEPLFPISIWDYGINPLFFTIFNGKIRYLIDHFLGITHSSHGTIFFISTITK